MPCLFPLIENILTNFPQSRLPLLALENYDTLQPL
jgi:hypothetical protein